MLISIFAQQLFRSDDDAVLEYYCIEKSLRKCNLLWCCRRLMLLWYIFEGFIRPRFYRWGTNCSRCHFVVVPTLILVTMVENRGTRKCEPNLDDPCDLCAYIKRLHQHPISLQRIQAMWWTIASMLPARELLVMQRIKCYFLDLKRCPRRWMLLRWHATSRWCESVSFDVKFVLQLRRSHLQTWTQHDRHSFQYQKRLEMEQQYRRTFQKNQYRKIVMNLLNLVMFCDLNHLVEMPYRDLICGG